MISSIFRLIALLTILCHTGFAAPYQRPDGSVELFQLEKIPLRVNTMKEISRHLVTLTCRKQDDSAEERRASAQLLALAMRLNPTNKKIREIDKTFSKGITPNEANNNQVVKAKSTLRSYHRWLASPDAGKDANLLANLMIDATKTLDSQTRHHPDTADWSKVLADMPPPPKPKPAWKPETKPTKDENDISELPKPDPTPVVSDAQFHLPKLQIHAPLNIEVKEKYKIASLPSQTYYRFVPKESITTIEIKITDPGVPKDTANNLVTPKQASTLTLLFSPPIARERIARDHTDEPHSAQAPKIPSTQEKITYTLKSLLQSRHGTFPTKDIKITLQQGRYSLSNDLAITAPLAIMLEASATNQPLRSDVHICAAINAQGKLRQTQNFWPQIKLLRKSESGGRLIVSEESSDLLMQFLVFGDPAFFTRWEIFTAETLDQAMALATETTPKNITESSSLFRTIQDLTKKSKVTQISVNSAVRNRLAEIINLTPNHLSSQALLIQGSSNRPSRLNSFALAHELSPIIQRIDQFLSSEIGYSLPAEDQLKKLHTELRESLDPLERIIDGTDDDLYEQTLKLTSNIRRLATLARRYKSNSYSDNLNTISQSISNLLMSMKDECAALKAQSNKIIKAE